MGVTVSHVAGLERARRARKHILTSGNVLKSLCPKISRNYVRHAGAGLTRSFKIRRRPAAHCPVRDTWRTGSPVTPSPSRPPARPDPHRRLRRLPPAAPRSSRETLTSGLTGNPRRRGTLNAPAVSLLRFDAAHFRSLLGMPQCIRLEAVLQVVLARHDFYVSQCTRSSAAVGVVVVLTAHKPSQCTRPKAGSRRPSWW